MKQIIYNGDKAYQLVRVLKEDSLKNPDISVLKQLYHCDTLLRKQGLLAMPNFYPWTVAKSFEFANKYNYNVTEVMPDGARLYVKWER